MPALTAGFSLPDSRTCQLRVSVKKTAPSSSLPEGALISIIALLPRSSAHHLFCFEVSSRTSPVLRTRKQPVLTTDHKRLDRSLSTIVIDLQTTLLQKTGQSLPMRQAVLNRLRALPPLKKLLTLREKPDMHPLQQRLAALQSSRVSLLIAVHIVYRFLPI